MIEDLYNQTYEAWFTDYPSTHERAGQTVEVVPRYLLDRYYQALVDIEGHENWESKTMGDIAREALTKVKTA